MRPLALQRKTVMSKDSITIIERFERGGVVAYSIDEGETYHPTVREAFAHRDGLNDLELKDSDDDTKVGESAQSRRT